MTGLQKALLGVGSLIPPLYAVLVVSTPLRNFFREGFLEDLTTGKLVFLFAHFLVFSLAVFLFVVFLVHLLSGRYTRMEKVLWVAVFIFLNVFSLPLYWFFRIRKDES